MSRNSTRNATSGPDRTNRSNRSAATPLPKSALGGAPGATGGGSGGQGANLNRATRRAIQRAQQVAASGDARQAAQILANIPGLNQTQTQPTGGGRQNQQQTQQQTQRAGRQLLDLTNLVGANVTPQQVAQLARTTQGAQAIRAEAVAFTVLLNAVRGMDLTVMTTQEIITLCQQATLFGLTFTAMTAPGFGAAQTQQQAQQQGRQQTQQQTQQNRPAPASGSRRSRKNRNRQAVTV